MWEAETSYYGGVVRRAVNPFHVIEVIPLLKVCRDVCVGKGVRGS